MPVRGRRPLQPTERAQTGEMAGRGACVEQGPGLSFWGLPSSLFGSQSTHLITGKETPMFQASSSSSYIVAFPTLSAEVAPS